MVLTEENKYMAKKVDEEPDESKEESKKSKKGKVVDSDSDSLNGFDPFAGAKVSQK